MILDELFKGAYYYFFARGAILLIEVIYLMYKKGLKSDALPNISCGLLAFAFFRYIAGGVTFGFFVFVSSYSPFTLEFSWWLLIITVIAADLSFYIYHRFAHRVRLFWTDHSVHHTSKEFDLTTNLRTTIFNGFYSWLPSAPILLLGVNPLMLVWSRDFVNDYTFFLHTCHVKKLGWLEKVFNTPSHHRVHHSVNPEYIDKNFGGMFIIWDKLFGTFAEEKAECVFGTKRTLNTKNPIKIMLHEWAALARDVIAQKGVVNKMQTLIKM